MNVEKFSTFMAEKFYYSARKKSSDNFGNHNFFTFEFSTSQNEIFNNCLKVFNKFSTPVNNGFNIFNNC